MDPQSLTYRSPVYRKLQALDAEFDEINGYAVAIKLGEAGPQAAARQLSICDLSGLARLGVKGPGTCEKLLEFGLQIPAESNRALRQDDGALVARLAPNEILILGDLDLQSAHIERIARVWQGDDHPPASPRGFIVPRQDSHAWFRITGYNAPATLAKLCSIDLRALVFEELRIAQTSVARLNAIVIRDDVAGIPSFHLLADFASAGYWWECLLDAGSEHDINVVGLHALRELIRG